MSAIEDFLFQRVFRPPSATSPTLGAAGSSGGAAAAEGAGSGSAPSATGAKSSKPSASTAGAGLPQASHAQPIPEQGSGGEAGGARRVTRAVAAARAKSIEPDAKVREAARPTLLSKELRLGSLIH